MSEKGERPVGPQAQQEHASTPEGPKEVDFFVSYTGADRAWAEWIAWQLKEAGYSVLLHAWDFRPGEHFMGKMDEVVRTCKRMLAVLSPPFHLKLRGSLRIEGFSMAQPDQPVEARHGAPCAIRIVVGERRP